MGKKDETEVAEQQGLQNTEREMEGGSRMMEDKVSLSDCDVVHRS